VSDDVAFTGERLHADDPLFGVDLARHEAAYRIAATRLPAGPVLELGSGSGYGAAFLATQPGAVIALDRVAPLQASRGRAHFVRADLNGIPLKPRIFPLVLSFQVIEHLEDPGPYLDAMARVLAPGGSALITTPNRLMSDGVNPFHVHEYRADELTELLQTRFAEIEMRGIGASAPIRAYLEARSGRIQRIMRLDPLGLRNLLPRSLVEWLFARFAQLVRRGTQANEGMPDCSWKDFPSGPADDDCLDLLAICRSPRPGGL
jgi:SAM-dependent methyltransferase